MRLEVTSDYGATTTEISDRATPELVKETMASLDWQQFHQVQLSKPDGEWLEVGGSIKPDEGLAVTWEEAGELQVIAQPPASVVEMTGFLLGFLSGRDDWKSGEARDCSAIRTMDISNSPPEPKIPLLEGFGFAVFGLMFLAGALMLAQQTFFGLASYYWPTAHGAITRSKVVETSDTDEDGNETITHVARCAPRRAKRRRVVPGRRRRGRVAGVAKGRETRSQRRQHAKRIRNAVKPFAQGVAKPEQLRRSELVAKPLPERGVPGRQRLSPRSESVRRQEPPDGFTSDTRHSRRSIINTGSETASIGPSASASAGLARIRRTRP